MRLSNIFDRGPKDYERAQKLEKLDKKLVELGEDPVEVAPDEHLRFRARFLEKVANSPELRLLAKSPQSDEPRFIACDQQRLALLDGLFSDVYRPLLRPHSTNSSQLDSEDREQRKEARGGQLKVYVQSNVPKSDRSPGNPTVCFLKPETKFLESFDSFLPLKIEKTVYDSFALTVYVDRERTGFEDSKDFPIVLGSLIAGRYRVMEFLGAASFAKCVHVKDLKQNVHCCLKIIENNKDFIDQSIDEIKLLRWGGG